MAVMAYLVPFHHSPCLLDGARVAAFFSAMVNKGRRCFTLSRLTGPEYGIFVGNGLSCGVNWHVIKRREERFENKYTFQHHSKYKETGPIVSSPLLVLFNFSVYKSLVLLLHLGEGSCPWEGEWGNLESTSLDSQPASPCLKRS